MTVLEIHRVSRLVTELPVSPVRLLTDLQLPDLGERDLDVLALEGVARLGELPQLLRVRLERLTLDARRRVVERVDEDGGQVVLRGRWEKTVGNFLDTFVHCGAPLVGPSQTEWGTMWRSPGR